MSYTHSGCGDVIKQRLESCFKKKGSLPSGDEVQAALEICMLKETTGPLYKTLDEVADKASQMLDCKSFWPSVSFTHDPTLPVEMKPNAHARNGEAIRQIHTKLQATVQDEELRHDIMHGECVLDTWSSHTRAYKLADSLKGALSSNLNDWQTEEFNSLVETAEAKGYTKTRDQFELVEEIMRRKEQYPGDRIYVFLGNEIGDFFKGMYGGEGKPQWRGAFLIHNDYRWGTKLGQYDSVVLAKSQVRTNQRNNGAWAYNRGERRWEYSLAVAHRFKIDVADYPGISRRVIKDCSMGSLF